MKPVDRNTVTINTYIHSSMGFGPVIIGVKVRCLLTGVTVKCIKDRSQHKNVLICFEYINAIRGELKND